MGGAKLDHVSTVAPIISQDSSLLSDHATQHSVEACNPIKPKDFAIPPHLQSQAQSNPNLTPTLYK